MLKYKLGCKEKEKRALRATMCYDRLCAEVLRLAGKRASNINRTINEGKFQIKISNRVEVGRYLCTLGHCSPLEEIQAIKALLQDILL
jgi:hypothetical protein